MDNSYVFPMSSGQERIWMLNEMSYNKTMYNLPLIIDIKGEVNFSALEKSVELLIQRYEILRTNFNLIDNKPVQIIYPSKNVKLDYSQIEYLNLQEKEKEAKRIIDETVNFVFDLKDGTLLKLNLINKSDDDYTLVVAMHHIISDGFSLRILIQELFSNYEKILNDFKYRYEELQIQYADYTIWQNKWSQSGEYQKELNYWKNNLKGISEYIDLPIDKKRPAIQTYDGTCIKFKLPNEIYDSIENLSKENGSTIFMTLFSAFSLTLAQISRQEEIIIGTPIANRSRKELENQIGFFLNTLVIRQNINKNKSYTEFLEQTRNTLLSAFSNSNLPFEKLIEEINPKRDLSYSPLFQVMFSMHDEKSNDLSVNGLDVEFLDVEQNASKFDLTLHIEKTGNEVIGKFEYNTNLFEKESIKKYISRYIEIINKVIVDQKQLISQIIAIPDKERNTLLEWNNTKIEYNYENTIIDQFESQVVKTPNATALIFEKEEYTYNEINAAINAVARKLINIGITKGEIVGLFVDRSVEMLIGILGIMKSGATFLPLDPNFPTERLNYMITNSGLNSIVSLKKYEKIIVPWEKRLVLLDNIMSEAGESKNLNLPIDSQMIAYMMYTSGSTGRPKGVSVRHKNVNNFFVGMDKTIGKNPGAFLAMTTYTFDISILELIWTLTRGFKVVIQSEIRNSNKLYRSKKLDFGLFYFASVDDKVKDEKYKLLMDGSKYADENGFNSVWIPERHFDQFGGLYPNPSVLGAALAVTTKNIHIRAGSAVLPLHNPIRVVEEWAVVDNLSNGRVGIAAASGWHADDFVFFPENYENRHEFMYESLEKIRQLWRGESVSYIDGNKSNKEVKIYPRPLQEELPVWITSGGNIETFKSAGKLGLNVLTHLLGDTIEGLGEKIKAYRNALKENGFDPREGKVSIMLHTYIGDDIEKVYEEVRTPLINYLKSSIGLVKKMFEGMGNVSDNDQFTESDIEMLLNNSYDRYVGTAGLIGTKDTCTVMLDKLNTVGVDEIACLIDFGLDYTSTMRSLNLINELKEEYNLSVEKKYSSIPEQLSKHQITHFQCTPSLMKMLNSDSTIYENMESVNKILLGGEKLPIALVNDIYNRMPEVEIFNMYGPTETTIWSTVSKVKRGTEKIVIGKPIANTTIHILDKELDVLPIGVKGEIYIGGDGVSAGYLSDHKRHTKAFIENPYGDGILYKTGDIGRYTNDGEIEIFGREDEQIKVRGYRIELGEIESVINECDVIKDVGVYLDDRDENSDIVACISLNNELTNDILNNEISISSIPNDTKKINYKSSDRSLYELPNGLLVDHYNAHTTNLMYKEVFLDNDYLKQGITLQDGACVIDAGANIGLFSLMVNSRFNDVKIFAFEPIPATYERLRNNFENHRIKGQIYNRGLSDKEEVVEFTHYPNMSGISGRFSNTETDVLAAKNVVNSYINDGNSGNSKEIEQLIKYRYETENHSCELTTISKIIRENNLEKIDLLKIDVEKSELLVLNGIVDKDWNKIEQLVLEVDTKEHKEKVIHILESKGYSLYVHTLVEVDKREDNPNEVFAFLIYATRKPRKDIKTSNLSSSEFLSLIKEHIKDKLPEYMIPSQFKIVDTIPLNVNGKIDRIALRNLKNKIPKLSKKINIEKGDSLFETISNIWRSLLQIDDIDPGRNFFDLGGHSLLLIKMQKNIEEILNLEISVIELFKYPTIYSLVEYLESDKNEKLDYDRASLRKDRIRNNRTFRSRNK